MRKKLLHNWALKLASLVLAVLLWFLVVQIGDPKETQIFYNVPVKLTSTELLKQQNKVYEVLDNTDTVNVTVRAPRSVLGQLRASDIVAEADISKLTDINTIAISYSVQNVAGVDVDSIKGNHDVVRLNVEDKSTKWVALKYSTVGEVAENYMVASVTPDQTVIEISGPKSAVDSVSHAGIEMDVTGYSSNLSANLDISLYDKDGNVVNNDSIKKNVNYVHMTVEVLATKEVPIEINYMGIPADGYMATGEVTSDPETVRIAGTAYALSGVNKISIPEDRLNITGESSDMTDIINVRDYLPENVLLADKGFNGKITVTIHIEPIVKKTLEIPVENISVIHIPTGLEALLPEGVEHFTLKVSGLAEDIEPLHQTEVKGVVDVAAWMEESGIEELTLGSSTIPITFALTEGIETEDLSVRVTFAEAS